MEVWKEIPINRLEDYRISNLGRLKNYKTDKIIKLCINNSGHLFCRVSIKGKKYNYYIHRLVISAFVRIPLKNEIVNHINNIRSDNRLENLEYVTLAQNNNRTIKNKNRGKKIVDLYNSADWSSAQEFFEAIMGTLY